jgi:hypothetical protein
VLTSASNLVPFALLDALILVFVALGIWRLVGDLRSRRPWLTILGQWIVRLTATAAVLYVAFVLLWGMNYRRPSLAGRLARNEAGPSLEAARRLVLTSVDEVNRHHAAAHRSDAFSGLTIDPALAQAFELAQRSIGLTQTAVPARPKHSLLDPYYRAASVAGMTNPFFLETLVASDLLEVELPQVIAHEWSHLAGINDEGEANFVAWLTGAIGSEPARYSAWLFMYGEALPSLPRSEREAIARRLDSGPREDLRAIAERQRRNVRPIVANAGWRAYDGFLKANRVRAGTASYGEVVQLVLQTKFEDGWKPVLASPGRE